MDAAAGMDGVELVFPNVELYGKDIADTHCSPLKDPVFGVEGNADHYNMIRMENAWKVIKGSGVPLSKVNVGFLTKRFIPVRMSLAARSDIGRSNG